MKSFNNAKKEMPKHFLKCDLIKTTPFDKEPKMLDVLELKLMFVLLLCFDFLNVIITTLLYFINVNIIITQIIYKVKVKFHYRIIYY
ncbi:hypothetical protein BAU16_12645 [Enterococcus sp. JM9B]|nr:hypothetical protein BAU16_12645 [Enterococcus sp. JM9B]